MKAWVKLKSWMQAKIAFAIGLRPILDLAIQAEALALKAGAMEAIVKDQRRKLAQESDRLAAEQKRLGDIAKDIAKREQLKADAAARASVAADARAARAEAMVRRLESVLSAACARYRIPATHPDAPERVAALLADDDKVWLGGLPNHSNPPPGTSKVSK